MRVFVIIFQFSIYVKSAHYFFCKVTDSFYSISFKWIYRVLLKKRNSDWRNYVVFVKNAARLYFWLFITI